MDNKQLKNKIQKLIKEILNIKELPKKASSLNVVEWDSLAYLTIISKIEKTFKIKINQKNINNFGSVENIIKEIKKCKKKEH